MAPSSLRLSSDLAIGSSAGAASFGSLSAALVFFLTLAVLGRVGLITEYWLKFWVAVFSFYLPRDAYVFWIALLCADWYRADYLMLGNWFFDYAAILSTARLFRVRLCLIWTGTRLQTDFALVEIF